jgi:hypothetical protein
MMAESVMLQSEVDVLCGFAWKSSQFKREQCGLPIIRIQNGCRSFLGLRVGSQLPHAVAARLRSAT